MSHLTDCIQFHLLHVASVLDWLTLRFYLDGAIFLLFLIQLFFVSFSFSLGRKEFFSAHSALKWVECEKSMRIETEQRVPITTIWHYPFISLSLLIFLFLTLFSLSLSSCQSAILCFSCVLPISSYLWHVKCIHLNLANSQYNATKVLSEQPMLETTDSPKKW